MKWSHRTLKIIVLTWLYCHVRRSVNILIVMRRSLQIFKYYSLMILQKCATPIQWRHNGCDGVSNHQPHDCLLNRLFRRRSKHESSASLAFVRRIPRWPGNSPHKWPVTRKMFLFDDVIMSASALPSPAVRTFTRDGITSVCARRKALKVCNAYLWNYHITSMETALNMKSGDLFGYEYILKRCFQIVHMSQKSWSWVV